MGFNQDENEIEEKLFFFINKIEIFVSGCKFYFDDIKKEYLDDDSDEGEG